MENIQEDFAIVKKISDGKVFIEMQREGSCDGCAMHGFCSGHDKNFTHEVKTDLDLKVGDIVNVSIAPKTRILSAFIIFVFPILMLILFYFVSHSLLKLSENISILISFSGLVISGFIIYYLDKNIGKNIGVEITKKVME